MIAKISGPNVSGVQKDPRRKAKGIQFKNRMHIPYEKASADLYKAQKSKATMTSAVMVAGSVAVTLAYFLISLIGAKNVSKLI